MVGCRLLVYWKVAMLLNVSYLRIDCYVAVTGVPDPMDEHAVVMAKFAQECMKRMKKITKQLETQLGPSTGRCIVHVLLFVMDPTSTKAHLPLFFSQLTWNVALDCTAVQSRVVYFGKSLCNAFAS